MNKQQLDRLKLAAEIGVGVVAVLALAVSMFGTCEAHRANQIAKRSIEPQVMILQERNTASSHDPKSGTVLCRERIMLFNGGQSTSVVGVRSFVSFGGSLVPLMNYGPPNIYSDPQSGTDILINVWSVPPPLEAYVTTTPLYQVSLLANGTRLPARVDGHTTTDLFVDITAKFKNERPPDIAIFFVLVFPDADGVGTGLVELC